MPCQGKRAKRNFLSPMFCALPLRSLLRSHKALGDIDLEAFVETLERHHSRGEYAEGICHYYSLMGDVISASKGSFWHFAPYQDSQTDHDAVQALHETFVKRLDIGPDVKVLEVGCGYGCNVRWLAQRTGADIQGLTLSPVEVAFVRNKKQGDPIQNYDVCEGDYHDMHMFEGGQFDRALAVYCLKYSNRLEVALSEIHRVLKPGGLFLSYEILTTDRYDATNPLHRRHVRSICSATSMPPLHNAETLVAEAGQAGLALVEDSELSGEGGSGDWYDFFTVTGAYRLLTNDWLKRVIGLAESLGLVPRGYQRFYEKCLVHPSVDFVEAGRLGIVTGSRVLVFRREA